MNETNNEFVPRSCRFLKTAEWGNFQIFLCKTIMILNFLQYIFKNIHSKEKDLDFDFIDLDSNPLKKILVCGV